MFGNSFHLFLQPVKQSYQESPPKSYLPREDPIRSAFDIFIDRFMKQFDNSVMSNITDRDLGIDQLAKISRKQKIHRRHTKLPKHIKNCQKMRHVQKIFQPKH